MKEVKIRGYNLDRFIDNLFKSGIIPKKMSRLAYDELIIEISDKEYKNLLVKNFISCYNIDVISSKSRLALFFSVIQRSGLVFGLLVALFMMSVSSNIISNITISVNGENKEELKNQAQQILAENDIVAGTKLDYSFHELENLLLSRLDSSARVLVKKNGNELIISINEIVLEPEPEHTNIVALYDGRITQINHSSGTLKVNVGEGVVKGQLLIESGFVGDFFTEAKGEIIAKVVISGSAVGSTKQMSVKRTGNVTTLKGFEIFNKTIALDNKVSFDGIYSSYEIEKEEIFIAKNMLVPVKLIRYNLYELVSVEQEVDYNSMLEDLKNKAYQMAENNLPEGADVGNVSFDVIDNNGYITVVCNIDTEISIGERR